MANIFIDTQHTHTHTERGKHRKKREGAFANLICETDNRPKGWRVSKRRRNDKKEKTDALLKHNPACMAAHQSRKPGANWSTCRQLNRLKNVVSFWPSWPELLPGSSAGLHFIYAVSLISTSWRLGLSETLPSFLVLPLLLSKEYVYLRVNIIILYGLHSQRQRPSGSHQFQGLPETNLFTSCFSELLFWMECFSLEDWYKPVKCKFSL